jgi:proline iminopeptidase
MPYPHASTQAPIADGVLAGQLVEIERRVITFDPPGIFLSTRPARIDMPEMLDCAEETLDACGIAGSVDVVGHSMGALCSLVLAQERLNRVKRLVLIGPPTGGVWTTMRERGIPFVWAPWDRRFWQVMLDGWRLMRGGGNLAMHKRLDQLFNETSYVDKSLVPRIPVDEGDEKRPPPTRAKWPNAIRNLDVLGRLGDVRAPTLICVGRFDPQTPVACSEELARGIPNVRLVIFEHSGHAPFVEEPDRFIGEITPFLNRSANTSGAGAMVDSTEDN